LARKNIVDFSKGWASGLARILRTFSDQRVHRSSLDSRSTISQWWMSLGTSKRRVQEVEETVYSNRFAVQSMPSRLYLYESLPMVGEAAAPAVPHANGLLTFCAPSDFERMGVVSGKPVIVSDLTAFLEGSSSLTNAMPYSARY